MWRRVIALVVPLGIDSFVVAAAVGLGGLSGRQRLRVSVLFAEFEGAMPLVGLVALLHDDGEPTEFAQLAAARGHAAIVLGLSTGFDGLVARSQRTLM